MIKLLLTNHTFSDAQLDEIRAMGYDMDIMPDNSVLTPEQAAQYEFVMSYGIFRSTPLELFTNLKIVHSTATGVEAMPIAELAARGLPFYKGKDLYSIPMSEWVICKLLEALKKSRYFAQGQRQREWRRLNWEFSSGRLDDLCGKRVLIVGSGDIGKTLASMLRAFEVASIVGVNTNGRPVEGFERCVSMDKLDSELPNADIVVITCPLTEKTVKLFDARRLSLLQSTAILVNVSRGKIIDEAALIALLEAGGLFWFISDVFETEPLAATSPLWEMDNVIVTPHNSFITNMRPVRMSELLLRNLSAYAKGLPLEGMVDYKKGY